METVNKWIEGVDKAPPLLLLAVLTLVFGYALRRANWIPNDRIPLFLFIFGGAMYPLMRYGLTPFVVKGALVAGGAWLFHKLILKRLEEQFPWLKKALAGDEGTFDTDIIVKKQITTDTAPKVDVTITEQPKDTK